MLDIETLYSLYRQHNVIVTDSRACKPGSIFFALKGERFDGNEFALTALEQGCAYAVVDRKGDFFPNDGRLIEVDDVLTTLQQLARYHRQQLHIPIIGITGTNGKTTTKELISAVLMQKYNVCFTKGNLNNHIGVPLTLLSIGDEHDIAVVEMGANHPKEIEFLCSMTRPTHGLITNVGTAHLEGFGSLQGVMNTKRELYSSLYQDGGRVFINANDEKLNSMLSVYVDWNKEDIITYSANKSVDAQVRGSLYSASPFVEVEIDYQGSTHTFSTHLVGGYNIDNIMAAIAVGREFEVQQEDILNAIIDYVPTNNRSQYICTERNKLIVDAYNANPTSMSAALTNFAAMDMPNKVLLLGDMLELGERSKEEHRAILEKINSLFEGQQVRVFLVGAQFYDLASEHILRDDMSAIAFLNTQQLETYLAENELTARTILIKGSNGIGLAKMVKNF